MAKTHTCNRCGEGGLTWVETKNGYRLAGGLNVNKDNIHVCKSATITGKPTMGAVMVDDDQYSTFLSIMRQDEEFRIESMVRGFSCF